MLQLSQRFCISDSASSGTIGLKTTLYELIEAVNEEIKPGEEQPKQKIEKIDSILGEIEQIHNSTF